MRALRWIADAGQDLRYVARTVRRSPGFASAVILTLALGVGANTAVFSVVNAVLLKPLPYPNPDRIVLLANTIHGRLVESSPAVSAPKFSAWRRSTTAFAEIAAYSFGRALDLTNPDDPQPVAISRTSVDFFHLFGAHVSLGRTFDATEDSPGGPHVAVVSDRFWRSRLEKSATVLGQKLVLDGDPYTIVGVLAPGFDVETLTPALAQQPDVWVPLQLDASSSNDLNFLLAAARLRDGVSLDAARGETTLSADVVRRTLPAVMPADNGLTIDPLQASLVRDVRPSLLLIASMVAFVLLIACVNTMNLLLVRASVREREIAIRLATGAGRGRIVRQLLTEGLALALTGGGVGLALGMIGTRLLSSIQGWNLPRIGSSVSAAPMDSRVLAVTLAISMLAGIVFGLVPAYRTVRDDLVGGLTGSSHGNADGGRRTLRALLIVSEVALAVVLLLGSALLIRSFAALRDVNPGFDAHNVLTMQSTLLGPRFATTSPVTAVAENGLHRLDGLRGVESVAATLTGVPLEPCCALNVAIAGRPRDDDYSYAMSWNLVTPAYFDVLRIPIVRGRGFTDHDVAGGAPVVLINQAMSRRYWPDGDPLRDALVIAPKIGGEFEETIPRRIVGIVGDVRQSQLRLTPHAAIYVPLSQVTDSQVVFFNRRGASLTWMARTRGEPGLLTDAVQREIRAAADGRPATRVRTMDDVSAASIARNRFEMWLVTSFGAVALLLAAVGLYGVVSYSVEQRRREIGIRMALGAARWPLRRMVLRQAIAMTFAGVAIGMVCAMPLARFMAGMLFGVEQYDRASFVIVPLVLTAVALAAAWIPARRASAVDPMIVLRAE
jgi:putative ABC transport system permease protein